MFVGPREVFSPRSNHQALPCLTGYRAPLVQNPSCTLVAPSLFSSCRSRVYIASRNRGYPRVLCITSSRLAVWLAQSGRGGDVLDVKADCASSEDACFPHVHKAGRCCTTPGAAAMLPRQGHRRNLARGRLFLFFFTLHGSAKLK